MALDSAAKRQAVTGVGRPWMRGQFRDASKGAAWRSSVGNTYPVTEFAAAVAVYPAVGVSAVIDAGGIGVLGTISATGIGVLGTVDTSFGVSAVIDAGGIGVNGDIDETGQGVMGVIK